jgi:hypothetical protein
MQQQVTDTPLSLQAIAACDMVAVLHNKKEQQKLDKENERVDQSALLGTWNKEMVW